MGGTRGDVAGKTSAQLGVKNADLDAAQTEEERMRAIMGLEAQNWEQEKQQMATYVLIPNHDSKKADILFRQQKVFYGKPNQGKPTNVPEGEPPHGYVCYRCGNKGMFSFSSTTIKLLTHGSGHWIQACPTNNDPNFKGPVRIKRTTGIPKSFLTKIEKPEGLDGNTDISQLQDVMVNADGDFVIAHSDEKTWKQYQEKQRQAAAAQQAVASNKELQDRGIECSIDKRMFVDPMKTPCCGRTYCGDCITNALIENDLVCPGCSTDGVLLDDLVEDTEVKEKIKAYEIEKAQEKKEKEASKSPSLSAGSPVKDETDGKSPKPPGSPVPQNGNKSPTTSTINGTKTSKKRTASTVSNDKTTTDEAPAMKRQKSTDSSKGVSSNTNIKSPIPSNTQTPSSMPLDSFMPPDMSQMFPPGGFPQMPPFSMPFMPPPPMTGGNMNTMGMMNPMMMMGMMNGFNPMANTTTNMNPMMMMNNHNQFPQMNNANMMMGPQQFIPQQQQQHPPPLPPYQNGIGMNHNNNNNTSFMTHKFANQQRSQATSTTTTNDDDNAYFRQPVNPHRHQNRQKRAPRPSDYREL